MFLTFFFPDFNFKRRARGKNVLGSVQIKEKGSSF